MSEKKEAGQSVDLGSPGSPVVVSPNTAAGLLGAPGSTPDFTGTEGGPDYRLAEGDREVRILYMNSGAETRWCRIVPIGIFFGTTRWHPEPQWFLQAMDIEVAPPRPKSFAMKDIVNWRVGPAPGQARAAQSQLVKEA